MTPQGFGSPKGGSYKRRGRGEDGNAVATNNTLAMLLVSGPLPWGLHGCLSFSFGLEATVWLFVFRHFNEARGRAVIAPCRAASLCRRRQRPPKEAAGPPGSRFKPCSICGERRRRGSIARKNGWKIRWIQIREEQNTSKNLRQHTAATLRRKQGPHTFWDMFAPSEMDRISSPSGLRF